MPNLLRTASAVLPALLLGTALMTASAAGPDPCTNYLVNSATGASQCFDSSAPPVIHRVYTRASEEAEGNGLPPIVAPAAARFALTPLGASGSVDVSAKNATLTSGRDGLTPGVTYYVRNYKQPSGDIIQSRQQAGSAEVRVYHYRR